MSTAQLKQRTAAVISLVALLSALLLGLARYESSIHSTIVHPTHVATYHIVDTGGDIISRHP
ncbi:MAG TPA: hypothetical protein VNG51_20245 [Ktedonobacteraceae bacterium]|nr:hypothetical protein [Ktedonobacteraceae bacterium]